MSDLHTPRDDQALKHVLHTIADRGQSLGRGAAVSRAALDAVGPVSKHSMTLTAGAGVKLARVEQELAASGLTLGPLPPGALELELAAFVEGPLAGLRAIAGGRLEPVASRLRGLLADGSVVETSVGPRSATGPDLGALFHGGDGRLALLTEATVRGFPKPEERVERRGEFPLARAFVDAVRAALGDGLWPWSLAASGGGVGGAVHAQVHLWGSSAQAHREAATWEKAVAQVGGRRVAGEPIRAAGAGLKEATWEAVERALERGLSLELSRPSLASVLVRGEVEGLRVDGPGHWAAPAGLLAALDPRELLGGAR
jgi:FAD/FMN-containing dehydrogenase